MKFSAEVLKENLANNQGTSDVVVLTQGELVCFAIEMLRMTPSPEPGRKQQFDDLCTDMGNDLTHDWLRSRIDNYNDTHKCVIDVSEFNERVQRSLAACNIAVRSVVERGPAEGNPMITIEGYYKDLDTWLKANGYEQGSVIWV